MNIIKDCAFQVGSYPCGYKYGIKLPDCKLCHKICHIKDAECQDKLRRIKKEIENQKSFQAFTFTPKWWQSSWEQEGIK